jgi:LysR family nitrogen assimilation transcriptional regulator
VSEITSIGILQNMLVAGIGVTVQARMPLAGAIERGELVARPLQEPGAIRRIVLCRSRAVPPSDAARAVWALVVRTVERLCAQGRWPGAERWA